MAAKCRCGCLKDEGVLLCLRCYLALPKSLRLKLWARLGDQASQMEAFSILERKGRIKHGTNQLDTSDAARDRG